LKVKKLLRTAYPSGWVFCTIILGKIQFGNLWERAARFRSDGILPYLGSRGTCRIALTFSLKWLELDGKEQPISLPFFW